MSDTKILIVEDDELIASYINVYLSNWGYTSYIVNSGEIAIQKAIEIKPDLILMDIKLPGEMDGIESAKQIRTQLDTPIVYVTAYSDNDSLQRAKISEPYSYLVKPIKPDELNAVIKMALYKHSLDKQLKDAHIRLQKARDELELRVKERTAELTELNKALQQQIIERAKAEESLEQQFKLEEIIANISASFINTSILETDDLINKTLKLVGKFINAERGYVFLLSDDRTKISNTHEWCADGIEPEIYNYQNLSIDSFILETKKFLPIKDFLFADTSKTDIDLNELIKKQIDKSSFFIPMFHRKIFIGFLGFDLRNVEEVWIEKNIKLLNALGRTFTNAIEHKRNEEAIQQSNKQIINILESITDAFMSLDNEWRFKYVNKRAQELLLKTKDELLGKSIWDIFPKADYENISEKSIKAVEEQVSIEFEGFYSSLNKWFHFHIYPYPDGLSIYFYDITEQVKTREERKRMLEQAMQLERITSMSAMSAGIVHEISQPLNSIKILADGMLYHHKMGQSLDAEEIIYNLNEISTQINKINEIIKYMRSFANIRKETNILPCNVNESVNRVINIIGRQLLNHKITVIKSLSENIPNVLANPNRLDEIIINLFSNAMYVLDSVSKDKKEILCSTKVENENVVLEISDNGTGIKDEIRNKIFEPFFTTKLQGEGMGLGLFIVKSVITSYGGTIVEYNNEMGGATFRIELPAIKQK